MNIHTKLGYVFVRLSVEGLLATSTCSSTMIIKVACSSGLYVNVYAATHP